MKKIHLIRHAKSSWTDISLADIERPLNQRGIESCRIMAGEILNAGCNFENIFCSVATRAQSTIETISKHLPHKNITWQLEPNLYTFSCGDLLTWCQELDDSLQEIVIVGHNPAMTDLCNQISDGHIDNLPTCGYLQLAYDQVMAILIKRLMSINQFS